MGWNQIAAVASGAIALVGAICTAWQIYQMTVSDAKARGLKHPKFWGFWAMNGNNSSGLILYLIGRRKYPVQNMSIEDQEKIETRKKAAGAALVFMTLGGDWICDQYHADLYLMKNTNTKSGIDVKNLYRFFQFFLHIDNFFIDCISKCSVTGCIQMLAICGAWRCKCGGIQKCCMMQKCHFVIFFSKLF